MATPAIEAATDQTVLIPPATVDAPLFSTKIFLSQPAGESPEKLKEY
ncbi:MAG: hypothetical protein KAW95_03080 [Dehalococcoidia bacterium]|nr:hypothetical protein [Dehalococcoidia bacterium]